MNIGFKMNSRDFGINLKVKKLMAIMVMAIVVVVVTEVVLVKVVWG